MKKLLALLILITTSIQAQYTIEGTMTPPDKNDWVILYKLEGVKQRFIANTKTKINLAQVNGKITRIANFSFTLPADAETGMYRVSYRLKKGGFVNFIFNKENISFSFNPDVPEQSIVFSKSKENQLFQDFIQANTITQKSIDSLQMAFLKNSSKVIKEQYVTALKKVNDVYKIYNKKSNGMLANCFIEATQRDNSSEVIESSQKYFSSVVDKFFNNVDFNSKELYNSSFLVDKITDYIFYLNYSTEPELQQKLFKESITNVIGKITDIQFKKDVLEYLITQYTSVQNAEIVDWIFANYYNRLPLDLQDTKVRSKNLGKLQAAIGKIAPNFSWKEKGKVKSLSTLKDGKNYLLVFWSTSCSHCIKEIPQLYKFMKTQPDTKVIAYALEKEVFEWNEFTKRLYDWHNAIGLNPKDKWDNALATETYQVNATPSYFVLDGNKKIIAKPNELKNIKEYYLQK